MPQDPRFSHTIIGLPPQQNPLSASNVNSSHHVYQHPADPHTFFVDDYSHKLTFTHHGGQQTVPIYYPSQAGQDSRFERQVESVQRSSKFTPNPYTIRSRDNSTVLPPIGDKRVTSVVIPQEEGKVAAALPPPVTAYVSGATHPKVQNTVPTEQVGERRYKDKGEFLCGKWGWILLALLLLAVLTLALLYGLGIIGGKTSTTVGSSGGVPVSPFPNNNGAATSQTGQNRKVNSLFPNNNGIATSLTGQKGKVNGQTQPTPLPVNSQTQTGSNKLLNRVQQPNPVNLQPQEPSVPQLPKDTVIPNSLPPSPINGPTTTIPKTNPTPSPIPPQIKIPAPPPAPNYAADYAGVPKFDIGRNFIDAIPVK